MIWIDYAILAIIGLSVLISVWRGFTKEALSLAGWIIAGVVAFNFAVNLEVMLESYIEVPSLRYPVAFAILFIATLFFAAFINHLVVQVIKKTGLSGTDRMVGIFFGVARGCMVIALLVLVAGLTALPQDPWWNESQFMHYFQDMAIWLRQFLPADFAKKIQY